MSGSEKCVAPVHSPEALSWAWHSAAVLIAHTLCFFIHYLGYFCGGDIIVWLYKQTFAWIWGSKGGRWGLRGAGWPSRGVACCFRGREEGVGQQGEEALFLLGFQGFGGSRVECPGKRLVLSREMG